MANLPVPLIRGFEISEFRGFRASDLSSDSVSEFGSSAQLHFAHALPSDVLLALYTRKPRTQKKAQQELEREGEARPIISDLQGRIRIEYKTYKALKDQVLSRYLANLPYMRRWNDFRKRNRSLVSHAINVFAEIRTSGRTIRPRVIAMLDGTGIHADRLLKALSDTRLLTIKRGRNGGIYYPAK